MPQDRMPASEIDELIAFADKIARRTNRIFVVNEKKCEDFAEFSTAIVAGFKAKDTENNRATTTVAQGA